MRLNQKSIKKAYLFFSLFLGVLTLVITGCTQNLEPETIIGQIGNTIDTNEYSIIVHSIDIETPTAYELSTFHINSNEILVKVNWDIEANKNGKQTVSPTSILKCFDKNTENKNTDIEFDPMTETVSKASDEDLIRNATVFKLKKVLLSTYTCQFTINTNKLVIFPVEIN